MHQDATFDVLCACSVHAGTSLSTYICSCSQAGRTAVKLGSLKLPQTPAGHTWEIKVEMIGNSVPGKPAVVAVDVIVFRLQVGLPLSVLVV